MITLDKAGLESIKYQASLLDPRLKDTSNEKLADAIGYMMDMVDWCNAGKREPRKTARRLAVLETRKLLVETLKSGAISRIALEHAFYSIADAQTRAVTALREREANGENLAIPTAKRPSRGKPGPLPGA